MKSIKFARSAAALIAVVMMLAASARADDPKSIDDQYQALAVQRAKAESAFQKAEQSLDARENGWDDINQTIGETHAKVVDLYGRAIRAEINKPQGERDQNLVDELNGQMRQIDQDWQAFTHEQLKTNTAHTRLGQQYASQRVVFQGLTNQERAWKDGNMDLTVLGAAYDAVSKSIEASSAKNQELLATLKAGQKDWDAKLTSAKQAVETPK